VTADEDDIIDEALRFFKANVFFNTFEMKGNADRLLVFLTLFTHQCIIRLSKVRC
jgi:actin related protein 2/3 complex subunit 3